MSVMSYFCSEQCQEEILVVSRGISNNCIVHAALVHHEVLASDFHHVYLCSGHNGSGKHIFICP